MQLGSADEASPAAVPAKKRRRRLSRLGWRLVLIVSGVLVAAASILGFYFTAEAFDQRQPVLVAARNIEAGATITPDDLGSTLLLLNESIPHVPWSPRAPLAFEGTIAVQSIPAGALVRPDMVIVAETAPVGVELEVIVPLDLSLAVGGVSEGELVLLADPGAEPDASDPGRPRRVVGQFRLANLEGSQMRLFLPPEEWAEWEALLTAAGGSLIVVKLGVGGDADETTQRLDSVWRAQWSASVEEIERKFGKPGPGELEVVVSLDARLAPSGLSDGDLVLLIDPGMTPRGTEPGRPRSVIRSLRVDNYSGGQMRIFATPEEWVWWSALPEELGVTPMVIPVAEATDVADMTERLNAEWRASWERSIAALKASG